MHRMTQAPSVLACYGAAFTILLAVNMSHAQEIVALPEVDGFDTPISVRVSGNGIVFAGRVGNADGLDRAFRWSSASGLEILEDLAAAGGSSRPVGLSEDGAIVYGSSEQSGTRAVRWLGADIVELGQVRTVQASSGDGSALTGQETSALGSAYRWTEAGGFQSLGKLPGASGFSAGLGIGGDGGTMVTGVSSSGGTSSGRAFVWTPAGGIEPIGELPGDSFARGTFVSPDGANVFGESWDTPASLGAGQARLFRWTRDAGMRAVNPLPGVVGSRIQACSFDGGFLVGDSRLADGSRVATVWTDDASPVLASDYLAGLGVDLTGWTLTNVRSVSYSGRVLSGVGEFDGQEVLWAADTTGAFPLAPTILAQPAASQLVDAGSVVELSVTIDTGTSPSMFQWRRNGVPLDNGGPFDGTDTDTLVIGPATGSVTDAYDVVVTNDAGSDTSDEVLVAVRQPCLADFDGDGSLTIFDFLAFQNAFDIGCP